MRLKVVALGITRAVAAISPSPRRRNDLPRWAGALGMVLGSVAGSAACYGLSLLF